MKLTLAFALASLFYLKTAFGQEKIWTKQSKISEVVAFEKDIDPTTTFLSKNVSLPREYYPLANKYRVANPLIVQRKALEYLPIYAEYFYTPGDSILRLVSYDWEKGRYDNLFDKQKIWKEENKNFETYNSEYERIKKSLIAQMGTPTSADRAAKTIKNETSDYLERNTLWETEVAHMELNMIFSATTHRIRLTLYWKQ